VQVKSDTTFGQLHAIIQMAMDWNNSHMHHFIVGKRPNLKYIKMASDADFDLDYLADKDQMSEDDVTIGQVLTKAKSKLDYEYDFGDGWLHEILVERIFEPESGVTYPRCVAGEYACPPDDVGGPPGYIHFVQAISNPKHPEYRELKEWAGGPFDPYKFDINQVNKMLSVRRNFILYGRGL
jgi:hypothetical protein